MTEQLLISIVFSFRNELEVLEELLDRTEAVFENEAVSYELIFVNDASTDDSLQTLIARREVNPAIKIINMARRFGNGPCVLAGFEHSKGDAVVYMDCDLQDPPELIPLLIDKWLEGNDVVHTTRTNRLGESGLKMWITKQSYRVINLLSEVEIPRNTGDFKLLSRRAVDSVLQIKESDPFLRGLSLWVGYRQVFVSYERQPRRAGKTHYSLFRSLNPYAEFIRGVTAFSTVPLYLALIVGFVVSLSAFVYLCLIVVQRLLFGIHLPGWPALMVTHLFLGGSILFTIGVLGIYVGKIYNEVKGRPRYVIESMQGISDSNSARSRVL
jgi:dolichol-phosphate mannosyltransferase